MEVSVADYPLVFRLTHEIICPKFSARVVSAGTALMVFEDGEWWCHGVNPGGMTECGSRPALAWTAFKAALGGIYADLACDAPSVEAFRKAADDFVRDTNRAEAERWRSARQSIRAGSAPVEAFFDALKKKTDEIEVAATVELLEKIVPEENDVELAAAA